MVKKTVHPRTHEAAVNCRWLQQLLTVGALLNSC